MDDGQLLLPTLQGTITPSPDALNFGRCLTCKLSPAYLLRPECTAQSSSTKPRIVHREGPSRQLCYPCAARQCSWATSNALAPCYGGDYLPPIHLLTHSCAPSSLLLCSFIYPVGAGHLRFFTFATPHPSLSSLLHSLTRPSRCPFAHSCCSSTVRSLPDDIMRSTLLLCLTGFVRLSIAGYTLEDDYTPSNFFDMFDFFTAGRCLTND